MRTELHNYWSKLIRLGFHLLYNQFAWTYDAVSWFVSFGAWREWQKAALPYIHGPCVLEIAHGPGHMLLELSNAGYETVGIDLSPQMGALSLSRLHNAGVEARLLRGIAQNLPFQSAQFDSVLATFPTDFLVADETLTSVHRVLKDSGRFVIIPEASFTGGSIPEKIVEWLYVITGQRIVDRGDHSDAAGTALESHWKLPKSQFLAAGFRLDIHKTHFHRSQVTVLLAQKSDSLNAI